MAADGIRCRREADGNGAACCDPGKRGDRRGRAEAVRREQVKELHCIMPIANLASVLTLGLLSHDGAARVPHVSVAHPGVQWRRDQKWVAGQPLHGYANLYFYARNPMMSVIRKRHVELCVLRIAPAVLDLPGVMVADRNAAVDSAHFATPAQGLAEIDRRLVFAERWRDPYSLEHSEEHKQIKCAEVLIPDRIDPSYIRGAYVSTLRSGRRARAASPALALSVHPHLFMQDNVPWLWRFALGAFLRPTSRPSPIR